MKRGFAFIVSFHQTKFKKEYDAQRDADEAIKEMDGRSIHGEKLTVEVAGMLFILTKLGQKREKPRGN